MDRHSLAIIIPALNESDSIHKVVTGVKQYGTPVVIDDGSHDDTGAIASSAGAYVIKHHKNLGYDAALTSGLEYAIGDGFTYAITIDADGQHDPKLVGVFLEELKKGSILVLGVRPKKARLSEIVTGWYFSYRFGVKDILCGIKGYKLSYIENQTKLNPKLIGTGLAFYLLSQKFNFSQINIPIKERIGKARFGNVISSNLKIFRALFIILNKSFFKTN